MGRWRRFGGLILAAALTGQLSWADDRADLGQGALDRLALKNFQDFEELSLKELLGKFDGLRFSLNAFGNVGARYVGNDPNNKPGFSMGSLGLLADADLKNNVRALSELAFDVNRNNQLMVNVERLHMRFRISNFYLTVGRVHTDLGYWNTAYHHGRWLQVTIDRPSVLAFGMDGGLLPNHAVGAFGRYVLPTAFGKVNFLLGVNNGRGALSTTTPMFGDNNKDKAVTAEIYVDDFLTPGLRIGAAGWEGLIAPESAAVRPDLPGRAIQEWIGNAHLVLRQDRAILISEIFYIKQTSFGREWTVLAPYAVMGYRFGRFLPYLMFDSQILKGGLSPFFTPTPGTMRPGTGNLFRGILGLRYEFSEWAAFKAEYRQSYFRGMDVKPVHGFFVDASFGI